MLKKDAKKFVVDRGRSKYSPSVCQVLMKIIDLVRVEDWKTTQIEDRLCVSKLDRIARVCQLTVRSIQYALDKLEADGLITVHRENVRHTYSVHLTEEFKELPYYKETAVLKATADKEARRSRKQRYLQKIGNEVAMLEDFNETINISLDQRSPEQIRANQLPTRHLLAAATAWHSDACLMLQQPFDC